MVTDYTRARDVLAARMTAVFGEGFAEMYPLAAQAPKVFKGFPASETPFYASVDEIADDVATEGAVSMGHQEVSFTVRVWLCARHTDLIKASDTLMCYVDAVIGSVMADPQLCKTVDNATARIETAGTAADPSRQHIAAASVAVRCTVYAACPAALAEVVAAANAAFDESEATDES